MGQFLDKTGLARLWAKCKSTFALKSSLITLSQVYPVGSIYMSVNSTNPSTLFGGTWSQLQDRFLLGAGSSYTNGATGGSATHTPSGSIVIDKTSITPSGSVTVNNHTLTISEMPSHSHDTLSSNSGSQVLWSADSLGGTGGQIGVQNNTGNASASYHSKVVTNSVGGGGGHNHTAAFSGTASSHTHTSTFTGTSQDTMPPYLVVYMWKRTA